MRLGITLAATVAIASLATAQATSERTVQLTVTSVSGSSIYLDGGRGTGLEVGLIVQLFPPGLASLEVEIRSVSNTSARAELPPGMTPPPVGTRGEVTVTVRGPAPTPAQPAAPRAVEHPPWQRQEAPRDADQPLLVPTFGTRPDERAPTLDGRLFAFGQWNRDHGGSRRSDYTLARLGVRADATNYFGAAERVRFAGEIDERRLMLQDADQEDRNGRLDLLSVAIGTEHWAPTGLEVGRFYSQFLPEIGLVDGAELVRRYEGGIQVGAGAGAYPRPFPARDTGEDVGAHAFLDFSADVRRSFAAAIGLQKTWHEGAPDRDLLLLRVEGRPTDRVALFGSAKVDFYSGSDTIKGRGLEITEAFGSARWDGSDVGTGLVLSHFGWPELKRREYQDLPVELVADGAVDRASWHGWLRPWSNFRSRLRIDAWRDQDRSGTAFALDSDLRNPIGDGSTLLLSLFRTDGGYSSGPGARVGLRAPIAGGAWRLGYRWHRYDLDGLVTGTESYIRQSAELGLSLPVGNRGDLDASLERWFGDREDAWSLGIYVQWRF